MLLSPWPRLVWTGKATHTIAPFDAPAELEPDSVSIFEEFEEMLRREEDWEGLLSLLDEHGVAVWKVDDQPLFFGGSGCGPSGIRDVGAGICLERVLVLEPGRLKRKRGSCSVCPLEDWQRLNHYRQWTGLSDDRSVRGNLRLRRAHILRSYLDDLSGAIKKQAEPWMRPVEQVKHLSICRESRELSEGPARGEWTTTANLLHKHLEDDPWDVQVVVLENVLGVGERFENMVRAASLYERG